MSSISIPSPSLLRIAPATRTRTSAFIIKSRCSLGSVKSLSKAFGLKPSSSSRVTSMAVYKVKLIGPNGQKNEFDAPDDASILNSAEKEAGLKLPFLCRTGSCSECAGLLVSGSVDHSDSSREVLLWNDKYRKKGYVMTCVAYPTSDCVIHTHKKGELY